MKLYKIKITDNFFTFRGEKTLNKEFWAIKTLDNYVVWDEYNYTFIMTSQAIVLEERSIDDYAPTETNIPIKTNTPSGSSLLSSLGSKPSKITIEF